MDYFKIEPFIQWEDGVYKYEGVFIGARAKWLYLMYLRTEEKQITNTTSEKELLVMNIPAFCLN